MQRTITAVIVGNGDRATQYAKTALARPDLLKIVGVVDPDPEKRRQAREKYRLPENRCYADAEELLREDKIADAVFNTTMDELHVSLGIPLLRKGYHMLMEKPVTNNEADLLRLRDVALETNRTLMVCHVLRYTPFYRKIKELILSGEIGEVMHISTGEDIGLEHASAAYIRGKWRNRGQCGSSVLLAKCCHDLDLLCWLMSDTRPVAVSSFGGRHFFVPEKAPEGSAERCSDCPLEKDCRFSAKVISLEHDVYPYYTWDCLPGDFRALTREQKEKSLAEDNVHGLCAWKTDADIADHQTVIVRFASGATAAHTVVTAQPRPGREIHVRGTAGEIEGYLDGNVFVLRKYDRSTGGYREEKFDFTASLDPEDFHFGGDGELVLDFLKALCGEQPSVAFTSIHDSVNGHLLVYRADESMQSGKTLAL